MNPIEETVHNVVAKKNAELEKRVRDAFQKHFGFPLEEVKDTENLERISIGGDIEYFVYRKQNFLEVKKEEIVVDWYLEKPEIPNIIARIYYREL